MTALCGVCASGADAADSQLADAGAKFEFLFSWYRVKDEASAKDFSEIGVTDIIAGGSKGVAAAKKYGLALLHVHARRSAQAGLARGRAEAS